MQKKSYNAYYQPAEDTLFFADNIRNEKGKAALDMGTGSGFLAKILSSNFVLVVATDINLIALKKAHESVENCVCCNAADALNSDFDLVVCNLPYLPSDEISDPAVDGLREGVEIPMKLIRSASNVIRQTGKLIYLTSSLANYLELMKRTEQLGFSTKILAKKKLFFEELILVECLKS
ncbi:Release factor glutamine methyltransferase [uncultured archaeon]|nr:Release factor glutamine methyltransferase [uncultured archaeon]